MKFLTTRAPLIVALTVPLWSVAANVQTANAQAPTKLETAPNETFALRSKWTAGEKLNYIMRLDGTVNIQASPNSASPLAGIPLDVDVKMNGAATLDTLSVDEMGTGTVALKVDDLKVLADSFGQKAEFTIRDGRTNFTMNGQRMGGNRNADNANTPPSIAVEISERGRILKAVPVAAKEGETTATRGGAAPLDFSQLAQAAFWSAIPALWPTTPVKNGDKWSAEVNWPPPAVAAVANREAGQAVAPLEPSQLGKFDFTLRGAEQIAGRRVVRVAVSGAIELDEKRAAELQKTAETEAAKARAATPDAKPANAPANARQARQNAFRSQLNSALQKVVGDVWFDVALGQIVRADLVLDTQTKSQDVPVPGVAVPPRAKAGESWLDFAGNLHLELKPKA